MAFADPMVVSIGGASKNLVRIDTGKYASEYKLVEPTQEFTMLIRNTDLKKETDGRYKIRHNISLRQRIFATSTTSEVIRQTSITIEHYAGDDVTAYDDVALAIAAVVTVPNVAKLNNFES